MRPDPGGGGGYAGDSAYGSFVSDLYEKLNRFAELYIDKTSTTRTSMYEIPPSSEEVEEQSDISAYVQPFLGAMGTSNLVDAIAAEAELIENLDVANGNGGSGDEIAGSRIETALGNIDHSLEMWEGQDASQFHTYLGRVRLALHRQEVLINALHHLAHVHHRIVARARKDLLMLLDAANEALESYGSWGSNDTKNALTMLGTAFAIGAAAAATGGTAALGLGIASAVVGGGGSLIEGDADSVDDGAGSYTISGDSEAIRATTISLIDDLKTDVEQKCSDFRGAVSRLRNVINHGGEDIGADDLLPPEPDVYDNADPDRFKLPVHVPVEP